MDRLPYLKPTATIAALLVLLVWPEPWTKAASDGSAGVPKTAQHLLETYGRLPLSFEANAGQTSSQVKFLSRGQGCALFLTRRAETVLALAPKPARKSTRSQPGDVLSDLGNTQTEAAQVGGLRMRLVGANAASRVEGLEELSVLRRRKPCP